MLVSSAGKFALRRPLPCLVCSLSAVQTAQLSSARPNPRQRRFSSSKPASPPNDDPRSLPAGGDAPTKSSAPSPTRKRSVARTSRLKTKDASPAKAVEALTSGLSSSLPSVPSTKHLHRHDVHVASFFSLHRPLSVTSPVPSASTAEAFSTIFAPRELAKPRSAEVIYTLSSAVTTLESATAEAENSQVSDASNLRAAVTQASTSNLEATTHLDGIAMPTVSLSIEGLAKSFRPFHPPPPPSPVPSIPPSQSFASIQDPFPISLLVRELDEPFPASRQPFLERMRVRQEQWEESREEAHRLIWRAISVKRQRRQKIKKHKYKKLQKATRTLRKREGRL